MSAAEQLCVCGHDREEHGWAGCLAEVSRTHVTRFCRCGKYEHHDLEPPF